MEVFTDGSRQPKKEKKFQKAVRSTEYFQNAPVEMMAGRVFLNISTQASHIRSSQRCFVGENHLLCPRFHRFDALRRRGR